MTRQGRFGLLADSEGMVICRRRDQAGVAEADLGGFALGGRGDFKEFTLLEAEHAREDVGGELQNLGVEVAHHSVVIASGVLDGVFDLGEGILQRSETLDGAELRIGFGKGKEAFERAGEHVFGCGLVGGASGGHGAIAGVDNSFESAFFMAGVAFDGFDEIGNQVVAALELNINVGPGVVALDFQADQAVVHADAEKHQQDKDDQQDDSNHRPTSRQDYVLREAILSLYVGKGGE